MNTRAISWAWKQRLPRADKRLLVALVDCADDQGFICHPSLPGLVRKTGFKPLAVCDGLNRLINARLIRRLGVGCYQLDIRNDSPSSPHDGAPRAPTVGLMTTSQPAGVCCRDVGRAADEHSQSRIGPAP